MIYQWAVIGAGPAGIAAVGKLIDGGISPHQIAWIDPEFSVGDFGKRWSHVPSNTKVELFLKFLYAANSFEYASCPYHFAIHQVPPHKTCELKLMVEPLRWVTNHLQQKVHCIQGFANSLTRNENHWVVKLNDTYVLAQRVLLSVGAEPKKLSHSNHSIISLYDALDPERITQHIDQNNTVAVFGSSHSAILILRNLVNLKIKKIINFYCEPIQYAIYLEDRILFDNTGLKGLAAEWARENIDKNLPLNFLRVYSDPKNIQHYLPQCDKVIDAVGFEKRAQPMIENSEIYNYHENFGKIAPNVFGLGIAYPELTYNHLGLPEYQVGLWKFMNYLTRVLPFWL